MKNVLQESHAKTILYGIFLVVFAGVFFIFVLVSRPLTFSLANSKSQPLAEFEYSWGDSPKQSSGKYVWLENPDSTKWEKRVLPAPPLNRSGAKTIWERVKLPDDFLTNSPAALIPGVNQIFEVYIKGKRVYSHGTLNDNEKVQFEGYPWHLIRLSQADAGEYIYLRVMSNHVNIGTFGNVKFGDVQGLFQELVVSDGSRIVVGILICFLGFLKLVVFFARPSQQLFFYGALLSLSSGVWALFQSTLKQIFTPYPVFNTSVEIFALTILPLGWIGFVKYFIQAPQKSILSWLQYIHVTYILVCFTLVSLNIIGLMSVVLPIQISIILESLYGLYLFYSHSRSGNKGSSYILFGIIILFACGIFDVLAKLGIIHSNLILSNWGMVVFNLFILGVLIHKYASILQKAKNAKIEQLGFFAVHLGDRLGSPLNIMALCEEELRDSFQNNPEAIALADKLEKCRVKITQEVSVLAPFREFAPKDALEKDYVSSVKET